jgi:hypothetical protein
MASQLRNTSVLQGDSWLCANAPNFIGTHELVGQSLCGRIPLPLATQDVPAVSPVINGSPQPKLNLEALTVRGGMLSHSVRVISLPLRGPDFCCGLILLIVQALPLTFSLGCLVFPTHYFLGVALAIWMPSKGPTSQQLDTRIPSVRFRKLSRLYTEHFFELNDNQRQRANYTLSSLRMYFCSFLISVFQ